MGEWYFNNLADYWSNHKQNSIFVHAQKIRKYPPLEQKMILVDIIESVGRHVRLMSDEQLAATAVIIADDIYKSANEFKFFNETMADYLSASAGTFFEFLHEKGYALHYLCNNSFADNSYIGLQRPLQIFRLCFAPAHINYICPHEIALQLMLKDGLEEKDYDQNIAAYLLMAEPIVSKLIAMCHEKKESYFCLRLGAGMEHFQDSLAYRDKPNIITAFRFEAPTRDSACQVWAPKKEN
ncbi:MAG: hypothetical protein ACOX0T_06530 [Pelotomaculum sp.]